MPAIVSQVKQDPPLSIEVRGKDKLLMLYALQRALPAPNELHSTDHVYVRFIQDLEATFRFELNKKD